MELTATRYLLLAALLGGAIFSGGCGAEALELDALFDRTILLATGLDSANLTRSLEITISPVVDRLWSAAEEIAKWWAAARAWAVAPMMRVASVCCMVMSVMLVVEIVQMAIVSLGVKILGRSPEKRYKWEAMPDPSTTDPEAGGSTAAFPTVLVQIPMYNEKEVYKLSIGAACRLSWPSDRIYIQVLDDSTDPIIKALVELECKVWASKGIKINYEIRDNRKGYKAGALKEGMKHSYVAQCDYVAIFDADFQPDPDFLLRTIPFLLHNPKIALVQARWDFVNYNKCLMTRIQKMSLDYHFKVEQEAGSSAYAFFGFNGTAGVWRISAINEAGGWKDRTTVEDMDLAVRASLKGWDFLYIGDIKVKSELPSTFKAYRNQQHRWTCGAANLFRKVAWEILMNREVSLKKKLYVVYSFFFVRKIITHVVTFVLYSIVIPASVLVPEVTIPVWGVVYIPTAITILNTIRNPWSIHIMPMWILFENVMSLHRIKATMIGLFEAGRVNEWVVTTKLGESLNAKPEIQLLERPRLKLRDRLNLSELGFAFFLLFCACYDYLYGGNYYFIYISLQSIAFFVIGLGFVGLCISDS